MKVKRLRVTTHLGHYDLLMSRGRGIRSAGYKGGSSAGHLSTHLDEIHMFAIDGVELVFEVLDASLQIAIDEAQCFDFASMRIGSLDLLVELAGVRIEHVGRDLHLECVAAGDASQ